MLSRTHRKAPEHIRKCGPAWGAVEAVTGRAGQDRAAFQTAAWLMELRCSLGLQSSLELTLHFPKLLHQLHPSFLSVF